MATKLTIESVMATIRQAKVENMMGTLFVPRIDQKIRDIVARVDEENREPTRDELLAIIHAMGYKEGNEP